jgi:hypothetical protein
LTFLAAAVLPIGATPVKVHGYITNLESSKNFDIDSYHVTREDNAAFEVDKGDYPDATLRPEDLRVGTELEVDGDFNDSTHELRATGITVFINDNLRVKRFAIVEHGATLQRDGRGWNGTIHADGQMIKVDAQTRFVLKEGQTNQLTPGESISYEGRREPDGSICATRLEVFENTGGRGAQKLWREAQAKLNSGDIVIRGAKYKLTPDAEAQSYVQRIGARLIPAFYQKDLSVGAARRISFQFYLVDNRDFNAHAYPSGTVLVNTGVLRVLANEAQFAAVLSHEIAHATQEHAIHGLQHQKKQGGSSDEGKGFARGNAPDNAYSRSLENQADRVGLEYMVAAGYDPREAAEVWKVMANSAESKSGLWEGHDDMVARRSYLLSELHNNYAGLDFKSLVRNREEFDVLAERFGNTAIAQRPPDTAPAAEVPNSPRPAMTPKAPAQSAGARYGSNAVMISSDPVGADVVFDGRVIGKTPMTLPTTGVGLSFTITVRKAGYRTWTGQMVSVPGRTNLRVDLLPLQ